MAIPRHNNTDEHLQLHSLNSALALINYDMLHNMSRPARKPTLSHLRNVSNQIRPRRLIQADTFCLGGQRYRVMILETENPQEAKSVYLGKPARHAQADPGQYFMHSPQCWFYRGTTRILYFIFYGQAYGFIHILIEMQAYYKYKFNRSHCEKQDTTNKYYK